MTKAEIRKNIKECEKRIREEQAKEEPNIKRISFLKATINRYSYEIGLEPPYTW